MMTNATRLVVIPAALWLLVTSGVMAETAKFQQGVDGYTGTKDVELRGGKVPLDAFPKEGFEKPGATPAKKKPEAPKEPAAPPKPSDPTISVDLDSGGQQSQAVIRFDNIIGSAAGQIPAGAIVTEAKLTLRATSAGGAQVFVHRLLSDWDAEHLTWETAKLGGNTEGGIQADNKEAAAPFTSFDSTHKGDFEIDITPAVRLWASGAAKNFGLALTCDSANGWDFETSEAESIDRRPLLTVTFTPPAK